MAWEQRKPLIAAVEVFRNRRNLVTILNFDRPSIPDIPGLSENFSSEIKGPLFRVLKETCHDGNGLDLLLYTRGGDTNAVWPIVSLLREFDPDFQVLVPFRCHSSGTLLCLGAKRIVLGPLSELSPIDPTTANAFNPNAPDNKSKLGISVEDVAAFRKFVLDQLDCSGTRSKDARVRTTPAQLAPFVQHLATQVHPLALGNVFRVITQIRKLAERLLALHKARGENLDAMIEALTTEFYSHLHMINRHEAKQILGSRVQFASDDLANALDALLGQYRKDFKLWKPFYVAGYMGDELQKEARFGSGVVESGAWSYLRATKVRVQQSVALPANVQLQVPVGQSVPLIPGMPRNYRVDLMSQEWERNLEPQGVTV